MLLVGAQRAWSASDYSRYQRADAIAITTYSAVFNTNPKLDDAEVLICDDAHAADQLIGKLWTVRISRKDDETAFLALYRTIEPLLADALIHRIDRKQPWAHNVDLVSTIALQENGARIRETLESVLGEKTEARYAFSMIVDSLHACNLYASSSSFEIGPGVPPTRTHGPFANARQRLYMSATLGDDGSIERAFGVKKIARLPIPEGWDNRGTGRRLILFPGLAEDATPWDVCRDILANGSRSLVLVPSDKERDRVVEKLKQTHAILGAKDIESNLDAFTKRSGQVALVLANRFDGIDLPGDDCRYLAIDGLPDAAGLQETYLVYRLGASALLRDRVRTRLTQAIGRCTRDEADYSAVLILGDDLLKWFSTRPNVAAMHPEIQAEIKFGFENSADRKAADFRTMVGLLMSRSPDWKGADAQIRADRNVIRKVPDPEAGALADSASAEIEYQYALWDGRLADAVQHAATVLDALAGGNELKAYRSFWHHQAATALYLLWKQSGDSTHRLGCLDQLNRASATSAGLRWLGKLQTTLAAEVAAPAEMFSTKQWFEQLSSLLEDWGLQGRRFKEKVQQYENLLSDQKNTTSVEQVLEELGRMLGFRTKRFSSKGAPDGLWWIDDAFGFVFESKLGATNAEVSMADIRETNTHEAYVKSNGVVPSSLRIMTILITDQQRLHADARAVANDITVMTHAELSSLYSSAAIAIERLRSQVVSLTAEGACAAAVPIYEQRGISPPQILALLGQRSIRSLL